MIEVEGLTKRYQETVAVDDLSFHMQPGTVTGFLGPERIRQVHDDAHDHGARFARRRIGPDQRSALPAPRAAPP